MRAYLIDPEARTVTETVFNGHYRHIHRLIGCQTFDLVRFGDDSDAVYIDDEGLLGEPRHFFRIEGCPAGIAGKGLVLGSDEDGESTAPVITLEELRCRVTFLTLGEDGLAIVEQPEPIASSSRPGDMAAVYAMETGASYEEALVACNMD